MTIEGLVMLCRDLHAEVNGLLTEEEWDAVQTLAQTMSEADAHARYEELRDDVLELCESKSPLERRHFVGQIPIARRGLVVFFARIALSQAANYGLAVMSALNAEDEFENPVRELCEKIERPMGMNLNYLGLF